MLNETLGTREMSDDESDSLKMNGNFLCPKIITTVAKHQAAIANCNRNIATIIPQILLPFNIKTPNKINIMMNEINVVTEKALTLNVN